ncbi:MAG: hypothetical protein J6V23_07000 [Bacteroidaceae bacterium]|nr:hypothetical protein [Bacteroidaceae bacterium]
MFETKDYELWQGDCIDVIKNIPDNSIDLVVTDPPYKIVQGGCTNKAVKLSGADNKNLSSGTVFNNNEIKFSQWIPLLFQKLKNGTHCYIMCNDRNLREILNVGEKAGFKLQNVLVWKKTKHTPNRYYLKNCEFIVMFRKGSARNINEMGTFSVLEVANVKKKQHPSEKPVKLLEILIRNSSNQSEIVLDPFMGAGSTGLACLNTRRKFIGFELDEMYFDVARSRIGQ